MTSTGGMILSCRLITVGCFVYGAQVGVLLVDDVSCFSEAQLWRFSRRLHLDCVGLQLAITGHVD